MISEELFSLISNRTGFQEVSADFKVEFLSPKTATVGTVKVSIVIAAEHSLSSLDVGELSLDVDTGLSLSISDNVGIDKLSLEAGVEF